MAFLLGRLLAGWMDTRTGKDTLKAINDPLTTRPAQNKLCSTLATLIALTKGHPLLTTPCFRYQRSCARCAISMPGKASRPHHTNTCTQALSVRLWPSLSMLEPCDNLARILGKWHPGATMLLASSVFRGILLVPCLSSRKSAHSTPSWRVISGCTEASKCNWWTPSSCWKEPWHSAALSGTATSLSSYSATLLHMLKESMLSH